MSGGRFVAGLRPVEQLLAGDAARVKRLYVEYRSGNPRVKEVVKLARDRSIEIQSANRSRLQSISGEARHQGVVAEISGPTAMDEAGLRTMVENKLVKDGKPLILLVLDSVQDPHNLGACLRSADAAGVDAVVVPRHRSAGPGPTVSKVAAGAAETVPMAIVANLGKVIDWLREYGVAVVGTSGSASKDLYDADLRGPLAIVMGGEHEGLPRGVMQRCSDLVRLPMAGSVESLNVSVATGICLFETVRQRRA
jgi:23S rRNA (guanosine2251-2'-O)-methyltransferase